MTKLAVPDRRRRETVGWNVHQSEGFPGFSAQTGSVARLGRGIDATVRRAARAALRRHPALRSGVYLAIHAWYAVRDTPSRNRKACLNAYRNAVDPWQSASPEGETRTSVVEQLIATVDREAPFRRGLDLGCGEGWYTERLARYCDAVLAVDLSPLALERARMRCSAAPHVAFALWDIQHDPPVGRFDLVLAICVLEVIRRPVPRRRARRRLLDMIDSGGLLIVMTTKQAPVVERAPWSRFLVSGAEAMDGFLVASGQLRRLRREDTGTHITVLYQRT